MTATTPDRDPRPATQVAQAVDRALDLTIVPGYSRAGLALRSRLPGWPADPPPDALAGQQVIVTGGSGGIGLATVQALADLGATVAVVVRDQEKAQEALRDAGLLDATSVHVADLGDLDQVRTLSDELLATGDDYRALVHNAGVMPPERSESPQGHELSAAVHVLGPVLLTDLLQPRLSGGRILFITSGGMYAQRLRADDPEYRDGEYAPATAYARSKRMQVELLPRLAERWSGEGRVVGAMHPGWVDTPAVTSSLPRFAAVTAPILRSPSEGADTTAWWCATQPPPPTGLLWMDRRPRPTTWLGRRATDRRQRDLLWGWVSDAIGRD